MNKQREMNTSMDGRVLSGVPLHELQRVRELVSGNWRDAHTARGAFLQNVPLSLARPVRLVWCLRQTP